MQSLSNPNDFFCRHTKIYHKIHMGCQETPNSQINLKKKNKIGGLKLSDFKTYYKAIIIKIVW